MGMEDMQHIVWIRFKDSNFYFLLVSVVVVQRACQQSVLLGDLNLIRILYFIKSIQ